MDGNGRWGGGISECEVEQLEIWFRDLGSKYWDGDECVVRDARGKWTIDCEKPVFKDRGITFDLPPIIECACLLHMHACIDM